jgi:hypothetical protein
VPASWKVGDCVRILGIPSEVLEPPDGPDDVELLHAFEHAVGRAYRIAYIDEDQHGEAQHWVDVTSDPGICFWGGGENAKYFLGLPAEMLEAAPDGECNATDELSGR